MDRTLKAIANLRNSPFRNNLPHGFFNDYLRFIRIDSRQRYAETLGCSNEISEECYEHLRELLTKAEAEAAEERKRRHELRMAVVKRLSLLGLLGVVAGVLLRLFIPLLT